MSTSSSEEGSITMMKTDHYIPSSDRESTESLLFSLPSDSSDVQTEITPPSSPVACKGMTCTPRDILDASRRLGQIPALGAPALHGDTTPSAKTTRQFHHCQVSPKSSVDDEAGYDADGDGDVDVDAHDQGARTRTGDEPIATTRLWTRPVLHAYTHSRRPVFPRIDTRQHRRVASLLTPADLTRKSATAASTNPSVDAESYELRQRSKPRLEPAPKWGSKATDAEPVGLGIGFPDDHPLRAGRAFSMPVTMMAAVPPVSVSAPVLPPAEDPGLSKGLGAGAHTRQRHVHQEFQERRRFEWLSSPIKWRRERKTSMSMTAMTTTTMTTATPTILRCDETGPFGEPKTSVLAAVKSGFPTAKREVEDGQIVFQPRANVDAA